MKIPLFKQKKNTCGTTALRMVFAYFGKNISENEIIKNVGGIKSYGVRTIKLAKYAKSLGFKNECLSYNKKLANGQTKIKKPNTTDILKFLKKNIPVIISVRSYLLFNTNPKKTGHFIVLTEYKNGFFYYNDPKDGKNHKIDIEELKFTWFNNVLDSSAYLLAIWV